VVGAPELTGASYEALIAAWHAAAALSGLALREIPCGGGEPLFIAERTGTESGRCVALSAGVHGDEPAAPWALLSLVRDGLLDGGFDYRIWCCTNPSGYRMGTRENGAGLDVNRSFSRDGRSAVTPEARAVERENRGRRFELSLDLHEDHEAGGFYCYEPVVDGCAPLGRRVVQSLDDAGFPVEDLHDAFDLGYPAEAGHLRLLQRGRVLPDVQAEVRHFDGLPYSMYLLWTGVAHRTMTLETPRSRSWQERVAMHRVAVVTALDALREDRAA